MCISDKRRASYFGILPNSITIQQSAVAEIHCQCDLGKVNSSAVIQPLSLVGDAEQRGLELMLTVWIVYFKWQQYPLLMAG